MKKKNVLITVFVFLLVLIAFIVYSLREHKYSGVSDELDKMPYYQEGCLEPLLENLVYSGSIEYRITKSVLGGTVLNYYLSINMQEAHFISMFDSLDSKDVIHIDSDSMTYDENVIATQEFNQYFPKSGINLSKYKYVKVNTTANNCGIIITGFYINTENMAYLCFYTRR